MEDADRKSDATALSDTEEKESGEGGQDQNGHEKFRKRKFRFATDILYVNT